MNPRSRWRIASPGRLVEGRTSAVNVDGASMRPNRSYSSRNGESGAPTVAWASGPDPKSPSKPATSTSVRAIHPARCRRQQTALEVVVLLDLQVTDPLHA